MISVHQRLKPFQLLTPALSSLKNDFPLTTLIRPAAALTRHFVPPSPIRWARGFLWDVYPGLRSRCSLTPGYYLSPRWGFQFGFASMDSLAPAPSVPSGVRLCRTPCAIAEAAQVVSRFPARRQPRPTESAFHPCESVAIVADEFRFQSSQQNLSQPDAQGDLQLGREIPESDCTQI